MTVSKRILTFFSGLVTLLCSVGMMLYPNEGYAFVILFLDISLLLYGLRMLIYYFTMARFMVGGIMTFYKSIIVIDFGMFVFSLEQTPQKYAMLYLIVCLAFSGAVDILQSVESRRLSGPWRLHIIYGFLKVGSAVTCLFFLNSMRVVTFLYCIGLIHSAVFSFISAFRKTAITYVDS